MRTFYFKSKYKSLIQEALELIPRVVFSHYILLPKLDLGENQDGSIPLCVQYENSEMNEEMLHQVLNESMEMVICFVQGYLIGKGVPENEA